MAILSEVDGAVGRNANAAVQNVAALKQPACPLVSATAEITSIDVSTIESDDGRSVGRKDRVHFVQAQRPSGEARIDERLPRNGQRKLETCFGPVPANM
jgi:hypothetical protein